MDDLQRTKEILKLFCIDVKYATEDIGKLDGLAKQYGANSEGLVKMLKETLTQAKKKQGETYMQNILDRNKKWFLINKDLYVITHAILMPFRKLAGYK